MSNHHHDAVVVGARAAGAATAMLLARAGRDVVVVDRSTYGSDTLSTHVLMRAAVMQLHRFGVLESVIAGGAPPVRSTTFHFPDGDLPITIKPAFGVDALYAPRRTLLDRVLVDAALGAGAEARFGVTATDVVRDGTGRVTGVATRDASGRSRVVHADLVIGADGARSRIADLVGAETTHAASATSATVYRYFSEVEADGYHWFYAPGAFAGIVPTNGGANVFVSVAPDRYEHELAHDVDRGFWSIVGEVSRDLEARLRGAVAVGRYRRFPGQLGHVRRSGGPGWALVGDAGYFKDPSTAHGISDALRDAELLVRSLDDSGSEPDAWAAYEAQRDRLSRDLFRVTDRISSFEWSIPEVRQLLVELSDAMSEEVELLGGLDDRYAIPTALAVAG